MNNDILAIVGGEEVTAADFEAYLQNIPQEQRMYAQNPQYRQNFVDQLIALRAYAKLGEDLRLDETDDFRKMMENARKDLLAQMAIAETLKKVEITDEEILKFYEACPQHFTKGDSVSAKHILVKEEGECNAVLASLQSGEKTFEQAAKECSTCPSGQRGGDLGEFGRGQMVKEFEEAAFGAEVGEVVGPVKTQFGYHLIKVEAKNPACVAPLEEVREQIRRNLLQQKQNQVYSEKAAELVEKYVQK